MLFPTVNAIKIDQWFVWKDLFLCPSIKINQNIHYFEHVSFVVESHTLMNHSVSLDWKFRVTSYTAFLLLFFLLIKWLTEKRSNTMIASTCWYWRVWDWYLFLTQFTFMANFKCLYEYKFVDFAHLMIVLFSLNRIHTECYFVFRPAQARGHNRNKFTSNNVLR